MYVKTGKVRRLWDLPVEITARPAGWPDPLEYDEDDDE